jgi:hypothetical protein
VGACVYVHDLLRLVNGSVRNDTRASDDDITLLYVANTLVLLLPNSCFHANSVPCFAHTGPSSGMYEIYFTGYVVRKLPFEDEVCSK